MDMVAMEIIQQSVGVAFTHHRVLDIIIAVVSTAFIGAINPEVITEGFLGVEIPGKYYILKSLIYTFSNNRNIFIILDLI